MSIVLNDKLNSIRNLPLVAQGGNKVPFGKVFGFLEQEALLLPEVILKDGAGPWVGAPLFLPLDKDYSFHLSLFLDGNPDRNFLYQDEEFDATSHNIPHSKRFVETHAFYDSRTDMTYFFVVPRVEAIEEIPFIEKRLGE